MIVDDDGSGQQKGADVEDVDGLLKTFNVAINIPCESLFLDKWEKWSEHHQHHHPLFTHTHKKATTPTKRRPNSPAPSINSVLSKSLHHHPHHHHQKHYIYFQSNANPKMARTK